MGVTCILAEPHSKIHHARVECGLCKAVQNLTGGLPSNHMHLASTPLQ